MGDDRFNYAGQELEARRRHATTTRGSLRQFESTLASMIEVGAGIGPFAEFISACARAEVVAIEPAANTLPQLRKRFARTREWKCAGYLSKPEAARRRTRGGERVGACAGRPHFAGSVRRGQAGWSPSAFRPRGPAISDRWTQFEHHRRYTRQSLRSVVEHAGWKPVRISYMNLLGIAAWFLAGRILKQTSIAAGPAKTYDRLVVPLLSRLEAIVEPPVGSNLVAIARKP